MCSAPGEAGAVPEPAQLQLQGQEHQGDAPLQQEIGFHLQKGAKKCIIVIFVYKVLTGHLNWGAEL